MANIKQQISDFRKSTPRHVQWLLLATAFIVVLILLTLLFTGRQNAKILPDEGDETQLTFSPAMLDLGQTPVGETKEAKVAISANNPIQITNITYTETVDGFKLDENCKKLGKIDNRPAKCMFVTYAPTKPMDDKKITLVITWRPEDASAGINHTEEYFITLGATGDAIADIPVAQPIVKKIETTTQKNIDTPKVDDEPKINDDVFVHNNDDDNGDKDIDDIDDIEDIEDDDDEDMTPPVVMPIAPTPKQPIAKEIKSDIKSIAPADPFAGTKNAAVDDAVTVSEACSDFAIPGYGPAGRQIGWIKPERGAYYFHPFSDKNCDNPTGIYNPDNGIITDIKSNGKRIGTDAEHIGYATITNGTLPQLSNPATTKASNNAQYYAPNTFEPLPSNTKTNDRAGFMNRIDLTPPNITEETYLGSGENSVKSTRAFDRQFILRQYKPIPATIVSEVRADPSLYDGSNDIQLPVRATVDRNVYADDGRNIILPTGTLMLGYVTGKLPGPYTSVGRMQIKWYQFILPNGVEFNFDGSNDPISGDSQGRMGVPGRGSTDYLEQFVMPMLTAIVPAAVNMIAPVADKFVNQIDLDNNTVVQSGTMRSSELAKNEIITAWNQVANKLLVDMMDNTTPPFSIAAGTRITVYSPADLIVSCGPTGEGKKCSLGYGTEKRSDQRGKVEIDYTDGSWIGQARSFNWQQYCDGYKDGKLSDTQARAIREAGLDYSSVLFYCQSNLYKAINNVKQEVYYKDQQKQFQTTYGSGDATSKNQTYNEQILGLTYEDSGAIVNPFATPAAPEPEPEQPATIGCLDGTQPDSYGCCTGEVYQEVTQEDGSTAFACCPAAGGDCFPPIL